MWQRRRVAVDEARAAVGGDDRVVLAALAARVERGRVAETVCGEQRTVHRSPEQGRAVVLGAHAGHRRLDVRLREEVEQRPGVRVRRGRERCLEREPRRRARRREPRPLLGCDVARDDVLHALRCQRTQRPPVRRLPVVPRDLDQLVPQPEPRRLPPHHAERMTAERRPLSRRHERHQPRPRRLQRPAPHPRRKAVLPSRPQHGGGHQAKAPLSCTTSPSAVSRPPSRRSQMRSQWTADSLTPPVSG
jgi:hypothetical protein